jgi:hypothetical protein
VDTFRRARFGQLRAGLATCLLVLCALCLPVPSARASTNASYDTAVANCSAWVSAHPGVDAEGRSYACGDQSDVGFPCYIGYSGVIWAYKAAVPGYAAACSVYWQYSGTKPPPANPCDGMPSANIYLDGKVLEGYTMSVRGPVQPNGSQAMCQVALSPLAAPTWNPYCQCWQTYALFSPTGNIAGEGQTTDGGLYTGTGAAVGGTPAPDPVPAAPSPAPSVCNTAACFNSGSQNFCAQDASGANIACVSGISAGSSGQAAGGSGCGTSGSVTICAGIPAPPLPVTAATGVTDPPTQTTASGTFSQANTGTGAVTSVGVTVYNSGGGSTSNGSTSATTGAPATVSQGSGSGPAGSSSSPASSSTAPGTFSGGTSCTVPPACTGDAVMCGIARTQWSTTCQLHTDLAGTGKPPASSSSSLSASQVWVAPTTGNTLGDAANAGSYDQTGGGASRTCPLTDYHFLSVVGLSVPLSKGCDPLWWLSEAGVGFALFGAARITAGSNV